ncbi:MAG: hypothetical protein WCY05_07455 [Candidatus Omnitrophota bacterium]
MIRYVEYLVINLIFLFAFFPVVCFCDTIVLNDGRRIEGLIVEKSDTYMKVEFEGVELKFYNKDIKEIIPDKNAPVIVKEKYAEISRNALIEKVLLLSNIKEQSEAIPLLAKDEYSQYKTRIAPEIFTQGDKTIADSYNGSEIYKLVFEYFKDNFNREYILAVKEFLSSPLSEKISELEQKVSTPQGLGEMKKFGNDLQANPPTKERSNLIKELDTAIGATDLQIETTVTMYEGMAKAVLPITENDSRRSESELKNMSDQMRKELKSMLKGVISISFLYTYQQLSDEELKLYINFWSSDAGKWFNKVSSEAFIFAMDKAAEQAALRFTMLANTRIVDGKKQ